MASLGDLVVNLRANTTNMLKGFRLAAFATNKLTVASTKLGIATTKAAANLAGVLAPATARASVGFVKLTAAVTVATVRLLAFNRVAKAVTAQTWLLVKGFAAMAGGAVLLGAGLGIKRLIGFDDAIRATGATARASADELATLRASALELGRTTSFTATEVANLMTTLGRAGFSPAQIDGMTDSVLSLARATGTDAEVASGVMAASLRQFSLGAGDATRVADVFTATANRTFNTVDQLGESMKFAGPIAHSLGMSIEETAAVLGVLGNVGVQGSLAGTAIRRLGAITAAESKKMEGIFDFEFTDAAGNAKPLIDMLEGIGEATKDLPSAERMTKMKDAFGLLGLTSATALAGAAGSAKQLSIDLQDVGGEAAATAEKMDAGVGGSFRRMMSAIDGMLISLGERLVPAFDAVSEAVKGAATFMTTGFGDVLFEVSKIATVAEVLALNWKQAARGMFEDLPKFAGAAFDWVAENAVTMMDNLIAMAKAFPGILDSIGKNLGEEFAFAVGLSDEKMQFDPLKEFRAKELTEFKMPEFSVDSQDIAKKISEALKEGEEMHAASKAASKAAKEASAAAAPSEGPKQSGGGGADGVDGATILKQLPPSQQRGSTEALTTILTNMQGSKKKSPEVKVTEKSNEILRGMAAVMERQSERDTKREVQGAVT